jgi:hypothetical protein
MQLPAGQLIDVIPAKAGIICWVFRTSAKTDWLEGLGYGIKQQTCSQAFRNKAAWRLLRQEQAFAVP